MSTGNKPLTLIPFGPFELDLTSQELRKQGHRLHLPRQSFKILKMLLERPGELVTREELRTALWPSDTFVDFEHGLNAGINRLREMLGDDADNPHYIETLPRRGYRFVGPLAQSQLTPPSQTEPASNLIGDFQKVVEPQPKTNKSKWKRLATAIATLCALFAMAFYWLRPVPAPRVLAYRQLTTDRQVKGKSCGWGPSSVVTDGTRVLFSEWDSPVSQVSSSGGDVSKIPTPFDCFMVFAISPDRTELLGAPLKNGSPPDKPIWVLSISSGLARRLGNVVGHAGTWSPDGRKVIYATGNDDKSNSLFIATADGSEAHPVGRIENGYVTVIRWSPNGKTWRMGVCCKTASPLWESSADGTNLHPVKLFPGQNRAIGGMDWTPGGRYFVFAASNKDADLSLPVTSGTSYHWDVWACRESQIPLSRNRCSPTQITGGVTAFWNPAPSLDGKHIFVVSGQLRGELLRYDLNSHTLEPYLEGISAEQLDFSRDGKWLAYVSFPEAVLWRSRVDGSERMQLTNPPLRALLPRWSPDGTRIAFSGLLSQGSRKLYVVSAVGGKPEPVSGTENGAADATWSPDGNSLVFGGVYGSSERKIFSVEVRTGYVRLVPNSEGMFSPRVSPDGRYIVTMDLPGHRKLYLFDWKTEKWSLLLDAENIRNDWPQWSPDSRYLYFSDSSLRDVKALYRVRIADHKLEEIARLSVPQGLTGYFSNWMSAAPDGSPLLLRDISIQEIYALDVDLP